MGCRGRRRGRIFMAPAQSPTRGNERRADGRRCVTRSFPLSLTHSLTRSSNHHHFHLPPPPPPSTSLPPLVQFRLDKPPFPSSSPKRFHFEPSIFFRLSTNSTSIEPFPRTASAQFPTSKKLNVLSSADAERFLKECGPRSAFFGQESE